MTSRSIDRSLEATKQKFFQNKTVKNQIILASHRHGRELASWFFVAGIRWNSARLTSTARDSFCRQIPFHVSEDVSDVWIRFGRARQTQRKQRRHVARRLIGIQERRGRWIGDQVQKYRWVTSTSNWIPLLSLCFVATDRSAMSRRRIALDHVQYENNKIQLFNCNCPILCKNGLFSWEYQNCAIHRVNTWPAPSTAMCLFCTFVLRRKMKDTWMTFVEPRVWQVNCVDLLNFWFEFRKT